MKLRSLLGNPWARGIFVLAVLALVILMLWRRGPDWAAVFDAFALVERWWIVAAFGLNILSVLSRAISWRLTLGQALPEPHPAFRDVFSAFAVGLLGNAVLPARAGELARVAVLRRHLPAGNGGTSATLLGTVFAQYPLQRLPILSP